MHFDQLKRREFITLIGGAAAWPLAARAQPSVWVRRIGIFMNLVSDDAEGQSRNAAFLQGLQELGWAVGCNVRINYRWGANNLDPDRVRKMQRTCWRSQRTSSWPRRRRLDCEARGISRIETCGPIISTV